MLAVLEGFSGPARSSSALFGLLVEESLRSAPSLSTAELLDALLALDRSGTVVVSPRTSYEDLLARFLVHHGPAFLLRLPASFPGLLTAGLGLLGGLPAPAREVAARLAGDGWHGSLGDLLSAAEALA